MLGSTETGVKDLYYSGYMYHAFCEYHPEDGMGYVTFSNGAVTDNGTFTLNLQENANDRSHAQLRVFMNDGSQKLFNLDQMDEYKDRRVLCPITVIFLLKLYP